MTTAFQSDAFQNNAFQIDAVVSRESGGSGARGGPSRRIHPRYIREYDPEDELPEAIQKRRKLTNKVEKLLAKQPAKTDEVVLDPFQNKAELEAAFNAAAAKLAAEKLKRELDEDDDFILLMI